MRTVTLATLRTRVRWRADVGNETQRFPDAELDDCINEGIAKFHSEIVRCDGQGALESSTSFMTANGVDTYPLAAEFLELKTVKVLASGVVRTLEVFDELDVDYLANQASYPRAGIFFYRLRGDNIVFAPLPDAAYAVTLRYTPTAVRLTAPSNAVDGIDGLEEYIVAWAVQRLAIKNRDWELNGTLEAVKVESLDQMRALVTNRNASEADKVQDHGRKMVPSLRNRSIRSRW